MKMKFIGVGSAFCSSEYWQSNAVITAKSGKKLLIDCGSDARHSLVEAGIGIEEIDGVYISHCHADHIGGAEWLGFSTYFNPSLKRPKLFIMRDLYSKLWDSLKGGMESIEGQIVNIEDYFDSQIIDLNGSFSWEGIHFIPVQTVHIMNGFYIVPSYGLLIRDGIDGKLVFFSSDSQFCPRQIEKFYKQADIVFHDCETSPFKSGVHAHYSDLLTLDEGIRNKMWLYHYQANPEKTFDAVSDGFAGFVAKGQEFEI